MKLLVFSLIIALSAFAADAPKPTPTPVIDPAIQIEVLATQYDLAIARLEAAPFDAAVKQKQADAQPAMDKAAKACGKGYEPAAREHKVVCAASQVSPAPLKPEIFPMPKQPDTKPDTTKAPK